MTEMNAFLMMEIPTLKMRIAVRAKLKKRTEGLGRFSYFTGSGGNVIKGKPSVSSAPWKRKLQVDPHFCVYKNSDFNISRSEHREEVPLEQSNGRLTEMEEKGQHYGIEVWSYSSNSNRL